MKAKEYLVQYKLMVVRIRALERDIERLVAEIGGGSINNDGLPHGTGIGDQTGRIAVRLADLKREREYWLRESIEKRDEIDRTILRMTDPIYLKLLHDRYVMLMDWNAITEDLGLVNDQYVRGKLHGKALLAVLEVMDEEVKDNGGL